LKNIQKLKLWKKVENGEATYFNNVPWYQHRRSFSLFIVETHELKLGCSAQIKLVPITNIFCNQLLSKYQIIFLFYYFFSHHYFHDHFYFLFIFCFIFFYTLLLTCIRLDFDKLQLFTKIILCFISSDKIHSLFRLILISLKNIRRLYLESVMLKHFSNK